MKKLIITLLLIFTFLVPVLLASEERPVEEFTGVVTYHLFPAKVMKINRIIEDPEPGTSLIGEEGILVELTENPDVMANWTVVTVRYREYPVPKNIRYEILSEQYEISVKYHADSLEITGDLSKYINQ